jgi:hypothetical protein
MEPGETTVPSQEEEERIRGMNNNERKWYGMRDLLENRGYKIEVRPGSLPELDDEDDISVSADLVSICCPS